jgi:hypothetical protein
VTPPPAISEHRRCTNVRCWKQNWITTENSRWITWCPSDRASWYNLYTSYQLDAQIPFIHITLQSSTYFEQYYAHHQEVKLYVYSLWYRHCLWVTVVVVQYTGWERTTTTTTHRQWRYIYYTHIVWPPDYEHNTARNM